MRASRVVGALVALIAVLLLTTVGVLVVAGPLARDRVAALAPPPPRPGPVLPDLPVTAAQPTPAALNAVLAPVVADPGLGPSFGAAVSDAATGRVLYDHSGAALLVPASVNKVVTVAGALVAAGPQTRIATRTVLSGGRLVLVGGGDSSLASPAGAALAAATGFFPARLDDLAARTAAALKARGSGPVALGYDTSLFSGPVVAPGWDPDDIPSGQVAPVTALSLDAGRADPARRARVPDPPLAAANAFGAALRAHGVAVTGSPVAVRAAPGSAQVASVQSPPLSELVEHTLTMSDNDLAEALARQVALHRGQPASFAGAAAAIRQVVAELGVLPGTVLQQDGSGLSRLDRVQPRAVLTILSAAARAPQPVGSAASLWPLTSGLPVAGVTGTLLARYQTPPTSFAAGVVRAKTGSLTGVDGLAGYAVDLAGRLLAFVTLADQAPRAVAARSALDRFATVLSGCGCR